MRYNIALHGVGEKVVVVDKVAGDAHGYAKLPTSISSSESSFTKHLRNELRLLDVDVEVITIEDPVLESIGVKGVESLVMKVDVEGFGLRVLGVPQRLLRGLDYLFCLRFTELLMMKVRSMPSKCLNVWLWLCSCRAGIQKNFVLYAYPIERRCLYYEQA